MTKMLNRSTRPPRLTKSKFLSILAVTGVLLAIPFSRADSDGNQSGRNELAGTWMSNAEPGAAPNLISFMADGRVIFTRPITVNPGPFSELVSTGHGEWIRTGNHEFVSTAIFLRSASAVEFTGFVKVISVFKLNRNSDQLASTGTVFISDADGNPLFSFPSPGSGVFKRVLAGQ